MRDQVVGRVLVLLRARFGGELRYVREACLVALLTGCCEFIFAEYHTPFAVGRSGKNFVFGKWAFIHRLKTASSVWTRMDNQGASAASNRPGASKQAFVE